jgi:hypothetical protein
MILAILETGEGFFAPIIFIAFAILVGIAVLVLRSFGKKGFVYSKEKASYFFSGNIADEESRVKASDYFWGFFEAMKPYYRLIIKMHTGIINDYVFWFVVVASLLLLVLSAEVLIWA